MAKFSLTILLLCLTLSVSLAQLTNPFFSTPPVNTRLTFFGTPCAIKVAPDQSMVVVGYQNGAVAAYSMGGSFMYSFSGSSNSIEQVAWIPNTGPIALDSVGNVYVWYKNGTQYFNLPISSSYYGIAVTTSSSGSIYVAFVSPTKVLEYGLNSFGFNPTNTYNPPSSSQFTGPIMYAAGYGTLFVSAYSNFNSAYIVYAFSCSTGKFFQSFSKHHKFIRFTRNSASLCALRFRVLSDADQWSGLQFHDKSQPF
jgi:hypothetical protein